MSLGKGVKKKEENRETARKGGERGC